MVRGLSALLFFVGLCYCCAVPPGDARPRNGRSALIACILLAVLLIIVVVATLVPHTHDARPEGALPSVLAISLLERAAGVVISIVLCLLLARSPGFRRRQTGPMVQHIRLPVGVADAHHLRRRSYPLPDPFRRPDANGRRRSLLGRRERRRRTDGRQAGTNPSSNPYWIVYLLQTAMSVWLLVLLTRLYRLIPAARRVRGGRGRTAGRLLKQRRLIRTDSYGCSASGRSAAPAGRTTAAAADGSPAAPRRRPGSAPPSRSRPGPATCRLRPFVS